MLTLLILFVIEIAFRIYIFKESFAISEQCQYKHVNIFLSLMWYLNFSTENDHWCFCFKAESVVRTQLSINETPKLWCLLGDVTKVRHKV